MRVPTFCALLLSAGLAPGARAATYQVTGQVLRPDKKPAAGARVWVALAGRFIERGTVEGKADAQGKFRLSATSNGARFLAVGAVAPGSAPAWVRLAPGPKIAPATITLRPPVTLTGRLIKTDGKPAPGIRIGADKLAPAQQSAQDDLWQYGDLLAPPVVLKAYQTRTGADGTFRIGGLPPRVNLHLAMAGDYLLAEGTSPDVRLEALPLQNAGTLVAVQPGAIQVAVRGPDGKPVLGGAVRLRMVHTPKPGAPDALFGSVLALQEGPPALVDLDPNGLGRMENLQPGRYELAFRGKVLPVEVPEGGVGGPVVLAARSAPLAGHVVDAGGKPAAGVNVELEAPDSPMGWPVAPLAPVKTDQMGAFEIPEFPWEAPRVKLRAQAGTALAEWSGAPGELKAPLTLTLKAGVLMTVKGRALLPGGKPLAGENVVLLDPAPETRSAFGAAVTDAAGRFEVAGVPRGKPVTVNAIVERTPLTSRAAQTPESGDVLDLGDVQLIVRNPGGAGPERVQDFVASLSMIAVPDAGELAAGRDLAFDYLQAVRAGNLERIRALTSRVSPGYSPELAGFLRSQSLRTPPEAAALKKEQLQAIPVVPRITFFLLFGPGTDQETPKPVLDALGQPDWVVVGYRGVRGVAILVVEHRDVDGWKVMGGIRSEASDLNTTSGDQATFGVAYPQPAPEAVLATARAFFAVWKTGDLPTLRGLTSPQSADFRATEEAYEKAWKARADGGKMPGAPAVPAPQPDARFSRWDLGMLFQYPRFLAAVRAGQQPPPGALNAYPYPDIRDGNVAVLRYDADGKRYLMLLHRRAGRWEVVEPALPG